jgi:regulator of nucleoside diphosphate kinase
METNLDVHEIESSVANPVVISQSDIVTLKRLAATGAQTSAELKNEIDRAIVVQDAAFPANTVKINSEVEVLNLDTGKTKRFKIVLPESANINEKKISVLSPMGTALIGFREGETVQWKMPRSVVHLKITSVTNN